MPRTFILTHDGKRPAVSFQFERLHGIKPNLIESKPYTHRHRDTGEILDRYIKEKWSCGCITRSPDEGQPIIRSAKRQPVRNRRKKLIDIVESL